MSFISNMFKSGASNDYNPAGLATYAPGTQAQIQNLNPAIATANTNYNNAEQGQNNLAAALQAQMNGQGPNLANAQLANATSANVANQASLMAGQRGTGANAGLLARQAAQQGATTQQQAAGQAAVNRAAQQLSAQQQLGSVYSNQANQANANLGTNQNALGAQNSNINSALTSQNQMGAQIAQNNSNMNQGLIGGVGNFIGSQASGGGMGGGGGGGGGGGMMSMAAMLAKGGEVPEKYMSSGGSSSPPAPFTLGNNSLTLDPGLSSGAGFGFNFANQQPPAQPSTGTTSEPTNPNITGANNPLVSSGQATVGPVMSDNSGGTGAANIDSLSGSLNAADGGEILPFAPNNFYKGGSNGKDIPAKVSPGEAYLKPDKVNKFMRKGGDPRKMGEIIPGKAKVPGDSLKNDVVSKKLKPHSIIIPRSKMDSPDKAANFVAAVKAKSGRGLK